MSNEYLLTIILLSFNIFAFGIGYLVGKIGSTYGISDIDAQKRSDSFFQRQKQRPPSLSIDSKKIVTSINTDGLEKKYSDLGESKESVETISSSINKLKNIKG